MEPTWVPKLIATVLLAIAALIFVAAERRACQVLNRLKAHSVAPVKTTQVRLIAGLSVTAAVALALTLWFLDVRR